MPVVRGEILYGIVRLPRGKRRAELKSKADKLFASILCEGILEPAGDHYANEKYACQSKGLNLDENDLWLAATALTSGAALVTRDNDFQQIGGQAHAVMVLVGRGEEGETVAVGPV